MGYEKNQTGAREVIALSVAAALSCALVQGGAHAQPMNDPMRPADAPARGTAPGTSASAAPGLQVVITSPQRKLALIDGAVVPLGAPVRDSTLAGVSDSLVVLKRNGARDVLLMHPQVEKKRRSENR